MNGSDSLKPTIFPTTTCKPDEVILVHPDGSVTVDKCNIVFPNGRLNSEVVFIDGGRLIRFDGKHL